MGNKEEKRTQCVTIAVLLMMGMTVEGTDPVCRPFCHLPPETHQKCSGLRFLFSCISKVQMRYEQKKSWNYIFFNLVFIKRYNVFLNNHILWKCSDECMAFNTCKNYYIYYITFVYQSYSFTRCTMNLHCSCEWLHALENVYLESERLAKVRKSNIFEQCTDTLKEDCGEFIWHLIQFCMWYCTSNFYLKKKMRWLVFIECLLPI